MQSCRQFKAPHILNLTLKGVRNRFFCEQTFISLYFRESSLLFCPFVPVVSPFTSLLSYSSSRAYQNSFSFEIILCRGGESRKCVTRHRRRHKRKKSITSRRTNMECIETKRREERKRACEKHRICTKLIENRFLPYTLIRSTLIEFNHNFCSFNFSIYIEIIWNVKFLL